MSNRKLSVYLALFLFIIAFPYFSAAVLAGNNYVFGGLLQNPIDGNSYLAKMYQGWSGSWKFVLPYTAEPGSGAYLQLYYIFLGHVARWTNIQLIWIYHLARILASGGLFIVLAIFISRVFDREKYSQRAFMLCIIGSGMGWLAVIFGSFTADFWLAEAYPFLSSYTNPHFPLTLMLMLILFMTISNEKPIKRSVIMIFTGLILSLISPFGYLIALLVLIGEGLWEWILHRKFLLVRYVSLILGGMPVILYQLAIVRIDPILQIWNNQNITLSPSIWDTIISLSPAIVLAAFGISHIDKFIINIYYKLLLLWAVISLVMMYFPFALQRRMSVGVFIPITLLAVMWIGEWADRHEKWSERLWAGILFLSIPTNLIIIFMGFYGIGTKDPMLYLTKGENEALEWIVTNTPEHALILASPDMGIFIPAHTGRLVIYGHPYETTHASARREEILNLFNGTDNTTDAIDYIKDNSVDYIFIGPRERSIGMPMWISNFSMVYHNFDVSIYRTTIQ